MSVKPLYQPLPWLCTLSDTSLEECALRMRPSRTYKLFVSNKLWTAAHILCRRIGALVESHPFAPYINVTVLDTLGPTEWFIEGDAGEAWGSEGL